MTLNLIAIGGLGNMLGPSAKHLHNSNIARYLRVLDRGGPGEKRDTLRKNWQAHGAQLVSNLEELIHLTDFDGIVICAGKNGDDYPIFQQLIPMLQQKQHRCFILHLSTVSADFVQATAQYCAQHDVQYANYPLTGGVKGAEAATMLILASGDNALYTRVEPLLQQMGHPKYLGEAVDLGACVKLIGHVLVFHGLLGVSLAVSLQQHIAADSPMTLSTTDFFDFLNKGAGGTNQWEFAVKSGVALGNWSRGFLIKHAIIDALYTIQLMQQRRLPKTVILPLMEIALLLAWVLRQNPDQGLATQAVTQLMANHTSEEIDQFLKDNLSLDLNSCFQRCLSILPQDSQRSLMLQVTYPQT